MAEAQVPSMNKSNAAGTGGTTQDAAQPPQNQITAAPQFVRQTMSTPFQFGGLGGGPLGGFSGGMGPAPQMTAGAPQMSAGGFAPPTAAMGTQSLVQAYPSAQMGQPMPMPMAMPMAPQVTIPGPEMAGAFTPGTAMGGYDQEQAGFEPWWTDPTPTPRRYEPAAPTEHAGEFGEVGGPLITYDQAEGEATGYGLDEATPVDPEEVLPQYTSKEDGEGYDVSYYVMDEENPDQPIPVEQDEDGNWVQSAFWAGETLDVDDYTYQQEMADRLGIDLDSRFELSPGSRANTEALEAEYQEAQEKRMYEKGAALRAWQEWVGRSGIAFSPTAMSSAAGQLKSQFLGGDQELDKWYEGERREMIKDADTAGFTEVENYYADIEDHVANYFKSQQDAVGGPRGASRAFVQYVNAHVERLKDMGLSFNEVAGAINQMETMFLEEFRPFNAGLQAFEDVTNQDFQQLHELFTGRNFSGEGTTREDVAGRWEATQN